MVQINKLFVDSQVKDLVGPSSLWGCISGDKKEMLHPGNFYIKKRGFLF